MTTRYVGSGGSDAADGLTWSTRKLTLNGVEDSPVLPGDSVYVGPGTYREMLTVDVSGTAGNPITYIGDYTGANTDKVGGIVRITGSDNDQTNARANGITATSRDYRTFKGFVIDTCTVPINAASCNTFIADQCYLQSFSINSGNCFAVSGAAQLANTIQNSVILTASAGNGVNFTHTSVLSNIGHIVQNCLFIGGQRGVSFARIGGCTVRNNTFIGRQANAIVVVTALAGGQTETVNNNIINAASTALSATALGEMTEDYNCLTACAVDHSNVSVGANTVTYPTLFDARWVYQLLFAQTHNQVISPVDLSSYSQLVNRAGTNPTTTDLRGAAVIGGAREWGAFEYNPTMNFRNNVFNRGLFKGMHV